MSTSIVGEDGELAVLKSDGRYHAEIALCLAPIAFAVKGAKIKGLRLFPQFARVQFCFFVVHGRYNTIISLANV